MKTPTRSRPGQVFLGIEAGGTRTVAAAFECAGAALDGSGIGRRLETGPANLRLVSDQQLVRHLQEIARAMPDPVSVAIGMAGARTESDRQRIRKAAAKVWRGVPCYATSELEKALIARRDDEPHG